jgi:putative hydrolase of HD superfamily
VAFALQISQNHVLQNICPTAFTQGPCFANIAMPFLARGAMLILPDFGRSWSADGESNVFVNQQPNSSKYRALFSKLFISLMMATIEQLKAVIDVLKLAERLKFELRHSYTSSGRQESVAEHTWRMSLMAVLMEPYLESKVDHAKLLKMIIIHDLIEAEAGDMSVLDVLRDPSLKAVKQQREIKAIENLRDKLGEPLGTEIYNLWFEFEDKNTYEAKVANAFDKLEVQLQHNDADISTWEEIEYDLSYMMDRHVTFDKTLQQLKDLIESEADEKMQLAGIDTEQVKQRVLSK